VFSPEFDASVEEVEFMLFSLRLSFLQAVANNVIAKADKNIFLII
jgi:hypothetical protein